MQTEKNLLDVSVQPRNKIINIAEFLPDETSYIRLNPNNTDISPLSIKPYIDSRKRGHSRRQRLDFEQSVYDATPENIVTALAIVGMSVISVLSQYDPNLLMNAERLINDNISNVSDFIQNVFAGPQL